MIRFARVTNWLPKHSAVTRSLPAQQMVSNIEPKASSFDKLKGLIGNCMILAIPREIFS